MKKTFKKLNKDLPFGDRVVVEMTDVKEFVILAENRKSLVGSVDTVLGKFVQAYGSGTVVDQAIIMENFTEWPNQGVVVAIGNGVPGLSVGDTIFLRGPNGISMKLEGRILRVINPKDIFIVRKK